MKNNKYLNIYKKLLIGTALVGMSMMVGSINNELNAGITGDFTLLPYNRNAYCGISSTITPQLMVTENDVCTYIHGANHKDSSNFTVVWDSYYLKTYTEGTSVKKTLAGPLNYEGSFPSKTGTLNYKYASSSVRWLEQSSSVYSLNGNLGSVPLSKTKKTRAEINKKRIYPKCTTHANENLTAYYNNGTYYLKSGTGSIAWSIASNCSANGGSSCDDVKNRGQSDNVAIQNIANLVNSNGLIPKGTTTNLTNWNLFGYSTLCTTGYAYCYDDQKPTCKLTLSTTEWTNKDVSVSRTCSDGGCSGCSSSNGVVGTHSTNGTKGGYACKDKAGNDAGLKYITISNIDKLKPVCGTVTASNGNYYYNTGYQVKVPCSDQAATSDNGKSGCKKDAYTVTTDTAGKYSVKIYDKAGNETTCSGTSNLIDTSKPTVTITLESGHEGYNSNTHYTSNATVTATISATDSGNAGIKKVCYTLSGATSKSETCVNGSSTTVTISNNGNTTITAYAYDNAYNYNGGSPTWNGNKSDNKTKIVYIDRTAPTVNFTTTPSTQWSNKAPTATFTASDSAAGLYTVQTVWAPTSDSSVAFSTYASSVKSHSVSANAFSSTASNNASVSGNIYLHVKVCDNAFAKNNNHQPNCTTKQQGPFKYDITNESTFEASAESVDWTHVLKDLTFKATNDTLGNGRSGLATINLYFDNNYPHTNTTKGNAKFNTNPNVSKTCATDKTKDTPTTCTFAIDFAALKSDPVKSGEGGAVTEGVRFIKVEVVDLAGNKKSKVFGPYKWDTTKSKFESNLTANGTPGKFYHE